LNQNSGFILQQVECTANFQTTNATFHSCPIKIYN